MRKKLKLEKKWNNLIYGAYRGNTPSKKLTARMLKQVNKLRNKGYRFTEVELGYYIIEGRL